MAESHDEVPQNRQVFTIVWNLHLNFKHKVKLIDILTPPFSLKRKTAEQRTNCVRLKRDDDMLKISSNFAHAKKFKRCTTYFINPVTHAIIGEYEHFGMYGWTHDDTVSWSQPLRIVFVIQMSCRAAEPPIIWQHYYTTLRPPIQANATTLFLSRTDMTHHIVRNDQGCNCVVRRVQLLDNVTAVEICPADETSATYSLLAVVLNRLDDDIWKWQFQHTTNATGCGQYFLKTYPILIIDVMELCTTRAPLHQ